MKVLVTGCSGLVGSEMVRHFDAQADQIWGLDNDMRREFFGAAGSTLWNLNCLTSQTAHFHHRSIDIRCRQSLSAFFQEQGPFDLIVHCAAQPSHDLSAARIWDDFDVNAVGTVNLLERTRRYSQSAVFVFMSTNKVYGDRPNTLPLRELPKRYDFACDGHDDLWDGIDETMSLDASKHSPFGASKVAADIMVQEFGRYFGIATVCLRAGCLTGPAHSGVQLHGFLSYLVQSHIRSETYRVFGYGGKQVRDNLHSYDLARLVEAIYNHPRPGEIYNVGGGRGNACSILEAFERLEMHSGRPVRHEQVAQVRLGDHQCYITNLSKVRAHYPEWSVTRSLDDIFAELWVDLNARMSVSVAASI